MNFLSRFQEKANENLFIAFKRILRYVKGTLDLKLKIDTVTESIAIIDGYVDSDWGGDIIDRKSTSGYVFKFFGCPVLWASKKQQCVSLSSTEAECIALALAVSEACWLKQLVFDFDLFNLEKPINMFEDNQSTIGIANNQENNKRIKHSDSKLFFCKREN